MTVETLREMLGWCTLINIGVLLYWWLMIAFAHDWIYRYHSRWFKIPVETFDSIHYAGMACFKIGIFVLNLVPYWALLIIT